MHLFGSLEFEIRPGTPDNSAGVTIALLRDTQGDDGRLFITPACKRSSAADPMTRIVVSTSPWPG